MNASSRQRHLTDHYVELIHVLGFAPLLALTGSLQHALAICTLFVLLQCLCLVSTRLLSPLLPTSVHLTLALIVGTVCTALMLQGLLWWQYALVQDLGIYLPLLAVNATLYLNVMRGIDATTTLVALRGALPGVLIMCALTLVIALLRAALDDKFAALATPFGVLIMLSLLLAAARVWQSRAARAEPARP